ncbi:lysM and putative peptidoglycan-binding domain-containing protein 3 isoform X1 [Anguilla rostrata]|uniref:lysM and putative peptidoglycan-binding domain-containing protein 3 isoform X1 n=2 Tax=Anguilla rostrata TaxID=7938 RepID=UPI0030CD6B83
MTIQINFIVQFQEVCKQARKLNYLSFSKGKMTGRNQNYGFQSATTVQPANGGHAYIFGNSVAAENEFSEEDSDSYELRPRGRERLRRPASRDRIDDIIYLVREIKEGDTLNAIALQYFCSVADIKRANNLLTEQDFFALRSLKIPVKRFSALTESVRPAGLHPGTARAQPPAGGGAAAPEPPPSSTSSTDSAGSFLQEKDRDIELLVKSAAPSAGGLSEVVSSLGLQQCPADPERRQAPRKDPYYGADWGMRWWTAVAIMLVVGIVTPVFYLLYYEVLMKADVSHHAATDPTRPAAGPPAKLQGGAGPNAPLPADSRLGSDPRPHFLMQRRAPKERDSVPEDEGT